MSTQTSRTNRPSSVCPPASGRSPSSRFTPEDIAARAEELIAFHDRFQDCFTRREQRAWSLFYLCGQLSNLARKTIEPMGLGLQGAVPRIVRAVQRFITDGTWNQSRMREHQQELIAADLGEAEGVVIVDGSGFPKQGSHRNTVGIWAKSRIARRVSFSCTSVRAAMLSWMSACTCRHAGSPRHTVSAGRLVASRRACAFKRNRNWPWK